MTHFSSALKQQKYVLSRGRRANDFHTMLPARNIEKWPARRQAENSQVMPRFGADVYWARIVKKQSICVKHLSVALKIIIKK